MHDGDDGQQDRDYVERHNSEPPGRHILRARNVALKPHCGPGNTLKRRSCAPVPVLRNAGWSACAVLTRPAFWLGRQPILDAMAATVGYELLFRSDPGNA